MISNNIQFQVELGDTDSEGIVFYPKYFRWFDRSTHALMKKLGMPHNVLLTQYHCAQPVIDAGCRFVGPVREEDHIRIESIVADVQEKIFKIEHHVFKGDELVASGYEVRCWVKTDEQGENGRLKAISIPEEIAAKFTE